MQSILAILLSYIVGGIPFGYVVVRIVAGKDIRTLGSKNIGATNVYRVLGVVWAVIVFLLDAAKGTLAVNVFPRLVGDASVVFMLGCGIAAVLGHTYTIFLKFKGGKGVAVAVGVILGLGFHNAAFLGILGISLGIWLVVFMIWRYVSLASLCAAIGFFVGTSISPLEKTFKIFAFFVMIFIIVRHRQNIQRLIEKKELKC